MDILTLIQAVIMGIIEGIAEFLPISSTGYLILSADVMNFWTTDKRALFIVFIQLGAILAVIYGYWDRLWSAFLGFVTGKTVTKPKIRMTKETRNPKDIYNINTTNNSPRQLGIALIVATLPVMILGFTLADTIKQYLFHPLIVATMLIVGALIIFYVEKRPHTIIANEAEEIDIITALKIGLIQCLALIPGTSRSGATIIGALWLGVSRRASTEFSFFLGIPVIIGAGLLDLVKNYKVLQTPADWAILAVGTAVSFIVALLCIRLMVAWVSKKDFGVFAWLRIATGLIVLVAYFGFGYHIEG